MKALITATAVMALIATQAQAEVYCAPRAIAVTHLTETYGEIRQSIGMEQRDLLVETWANPDTGSFTVTITGADGEMCFALTGDGYEGLAGALPKGDEL